MPDLAQLKQAVSKGVIPFVGAGISRQVCDHLGERMYPSWDGLLAAGIDRVEKKGDDAGATAMRRRMKRSDVNKVRLASEIRTRLGPAEWAAFLRDQLHPNLRMADEATFVAADAIWALGSDLVITTNVDLVLEFRSPDLRFLGKWDIENVAGIAEWARESGRRSDRSRDPVLWYLHGRIDNLDRIVLTFDEYKKLYSRSGIYDAALDGLRTAMLYKPFLFIGFSLTDRYLGHVLSALRKAFHGYVGHFALLCKEEEQYRAAAERLKAEKSLQDSYGVSVEWFERFEELPDLLRELRAHAPLPETKRKPKFVVDLDKPEPDGFYGRDAEVADLAARLLTDEDQVISIWGPPGCGKSRLAREVGRRLKADNTAAVCYRDMSEANTVTGIIDGVAQALEIAPAEHGAPLTELIPNALPSQPATVLILDDFDKGTSHAEETIASWAPAAPHVKYLVTSRRRLEIPCRSIKLRPLRIPEGVAGREIAAVAIADEPTVQLFVRRRRQRDDEFALTDENAAAIVELCRGLEGFPLSIELAARLPLLQPRELVDRLSTKLTLLESGPHGRSLRAAIAISFDELTGDDLDAALQCHVFRDGFFVDAAEKVIDLRTDDRGVFAALQTLVDSSLLRFERLPFGTRCRYDGSALQEYADRRWRRTASAREKRELRCRHALYYREYAAKWHERVNRRETLDALDRLWLDVENLAAAVDNALDHGLAGAATDISIVLSRLFSVRSMEQARAPRLLRCLAVVPSDDQVSRARLLTELAHASIEAAATRDAVRYARQADKATAGLGAGHERERVDALLAFGRALLVDSQITEAGSRVDEARTLAEQLDDTFRQCEAWIGLGDWHRVQGAASWAWKAYEEALRRNAVLGSQLVEVRVLHRQAIVRSEGGDQTTALALCASAEDLARRLNLPRILWSVGLTRAAGLVRRGEATSAIELLTQLEEDARERGDLAGQMLALANRGDALSATADLGRAHDDMVASARIAERIGKKDSYAVSMANVAMNLLRRRRELEALEAAKEAHVLYEKLSLFRQKNGWIIRATLACAEDGAGHRATAVRLARDAIAEAGRRGFTDHDDVEIQEFLSALGRIVERGDTARRAAAGKRSTGRRRRPS